MFDKGGTWTSCARQGSIIWCLCFLLLFLLLLSELDDRFDGGGARSSSGGRDRSRSRGRDINGDGGTSNKRLDRPFDRVNMEAIPTSGLFEGTREKIFASTITSADWRPSVSYRGWWGLLLSNGTCGRSGCWGNHRTTRWSRCGFGGDGSRG